MTNPYIHGSVELRYLPSSLRLGGGHGHDGNDEDPLERGKQLPSHGFRQRQSPSYSAGRRGLLRADQAALEGDPRELFPRRRRGPAWLVETAGEAARGRGDEGREGGERDASRQGGSRA